MTNLKVTQTNWYPDKKLIVTQISGDIDKTDIENWENSLKKSLEQIKNDETFKILVNLHSFQAVDLDAHKKFRSIIPLTLAKYGWKVGYVDLFEEDAKTISYTNTRGIKCIAAAHCHQDETKIELYETRYSRDNEHFFTDPDQAEKWIDKVKISG